MALGATRQQIEVAAGSVLAQQDVEESVRKAQPKISLAISAAIMANNKVLEEQLKAAGVKL